MATTTGVPTRSRIPLITEARVHILGGGGSRTPPANLPRSLLVLQEVKYLPRSKPTCVINQFNIFLKPQRPGMLRVYGPRWSHLQWKAGLCQQQLDTGHRRSSPGSSSAAVLGKDLSVQAFLLCCENLGGPGTQSHLPLSRARGPKIGDLILKGCTVEASLSPIRIALISTCQAISAKKTDHIFLRPGSIQQSSLQVRMPCELATWPANSPSPEGPPGPKSSEKQLCPLQTLVNKMAKPHSVSSGSAPLPDFNILNQNSTSSSPSFMLFLSDVCLLSAPPPRIHRRRSR